MVSFIKARLRQITYSIRFYTRIIKVYLVSFILNAEFFSFFFFNQNPEDTKIIHMKQYLFTFIFSTRLNSHAQKKTYGHNIFSKLFHWWKKQGGTYIMTIFVPVATDHKCWNVLFINYTICVLYKSTKLQTKLIHYFKVIDRFQLFFMVISKNFFSCIEYIILTQVKRIGH